MGKSIFITQIADKEALRAAIKSVVAHNVSPMTPLGGQYTDEEFALLDPMRHKVGLNDLVIPGAERVSSCQDKWTRGEDICSGGCFVRFDNKLWLEVHNHGGGACSTLWLRANAADVGWIGTEGKPEGFFEAPSVGEGANWAETFALGARLLDE